MCVVAVRRVPQDVKTDVPTGRVRREADGWSRTDRLRHSGTMGHEGLLSPRWQTLFTASPFPLLKKGPHMDMDATEKKEGLFVFFVTRLIWACRSDGTAPGTEPCWWSGGFARALKIRRSM